MVGQQGVKKLQRPEGFVIQYSDLLFGFCKDVFSELPLEFAVEAQKLLAISLEHSVG